jgi:hypothetical protein
MEKERPPKTAAFLVAALGHFGSFQPIDFKRRSTSITITDGGNVADE